MLLLDTCVLLWLDSDPARISAHAMENLRIHEQALYFSAISALEIGTKCRKGKLIPPMPPAQWLAEIVRSHGLIEKTIDSEIAMRAASLPLLHSDPFDRLLIATAQIHKMTIVTPDSEIAKYPDITILW